ncbi:MAG: iron-containing alcohol dehydrogenase [Clostridia bacterium]|nr:iron-containing alcohol dehydrogenase [Clostridia bacterium]
MNDFTFSMPTMVHFGKGKEMLVGDLIKQQQAKKILLHYGSGSIKETGLYNKVIDSLHKSNIDYVELGGVHSNPKLGLVKQGITICKERGIDFILAVGGGSVIDSSKTIAIGVPYEGDVWDFYLKKETVKKALPVGVILTVPATASETNRCAVITNEEGMFKRGLKDVHVKPAFAIMNPELTYTLSDYHMAVSIIDIFAHVWERYFTKQEHSDLQDKMCEAIFRTLIKQSYQAVKERDYKTCSDIMWASSIAHNDLLGEIGDFGAHRTGHEISAKYDLSHGGSLAITMGAWAKYVFKEDINRFCQFSVNVWDVEYDYDCPERTALEGIRRMEMFIHRLGIPTTFTHAELPINEFEQMAEKAVNNGLGYVGGPFKKLSKIDIINIYRLAI